MGRWRSKIVCAILMYGLGFATAVYVLAPVDEQTSESTQCSVANPDSDWNQHHLQAAQGAIKMRLGMEKFMQFAEEKTARTAEFIKTKIAEQRAKGG